MLLPKICLCINTVSKAGRKRCSGWDYCLKQSQRLSHTVFLLCKAMLQRWTDTWSPDAWADCLVHILSERGAGFQVLFVTLGKLINSKFPITRIMVKFGGWQHWHSQTQIKSANRVIEANSAFISVLNKLCSMFLPAKLKIIKQHIHKSLQFSFFAVTLLVSVKITSTDLPQSTCWEHGINVVIFIWKNVSLASCNHQTKDFFLIMFMICFLQK